MMTDTQRQSFDSYYMHHFFSDVYSNARTGVLKVYFPEDVVKTVFFSDGNTIYASSNGERDKLVNILIKYKKLSREQLETALRQMDKSISLGRNLVNMGFITHKELIWAVKVQVIGIMHSIITLREGEYQFTEGPLPDGVINLPLNTMKVLFDSLLMFQDREWISEQVHYPSAVYKKTILFEEGKSRLMTNAELLDVAEAIDGSKTVEELAGLSNIEDFKIFKLLYALRFLNLIEEKVETPPLVEQGDQIFEIADEPEEALELAEESLGQLSQQEATAGELEPEPIPLDELEEAKSEPDEIPLTEITAESEQEGVAIGASSDATLIETIRPDATGEKADNDTATSLTEENQLPYQEQHTGKEDVFVEFQLESSASQSVDETQPIGVPSSGKPVEDSARPDDDSRLSVREGIALTEEDLDSVILGENEPANEVEETVRLERADVDSVPEDQTVLEEDSLSFSEEIVMPDSSGGNWFLLGLILITVLAGTAGLYYFKFYLPSRSQTGVSTSQSTLSAQPVQVPSAKTDVTGETVQVTPQGGLMEAGQSTTAAGEKPEITESEPEKATSEVPAQTQVASTDQSAVTHPAAVETKQPEPTQAVASTPEAAGETSSSVSEPVAPEPEPVAQPALPQEPQQTKTADVSSSGPSVDMGAYQVFLDQARKDFPGAAGQFTLQLEIACEAETIDQAVRLLQPDTSVYLIPFRLGGRSCYIVAFGIYPDRVSAQQALEQMPEVFFENNEPFVASIEPLRARLR